MLILKIAFRNIFRQRRRSFFTALTMVGGYVLFSLALSISEGTYGTVIEKFTSSSTGHLQIHKAGYFETPSIYKTIDDFAATEVLIKKMQEVKSYTPRVFSASLASKDKKTSMAKIVGINPATEEKTTAIKEKIKTGQYLNPTPEAINYNEVMIGSSLAEVLNIKLGEDFVLVGQGADGSISNDIFKVVAILKGDNFSSDRNTCFMHIKVAQKFLSLDNRIHEVAVALSDYNLSEAKTNEFNKIVASSADLQTEIVAKPWQEIERQFYNTMIFEKKGMRICLFIIVLIVAIGVLNTVLMAILERTVEYGVLKALGTRPTTIFQLIVLESAILSALSVLIGFILSFILNSLVAKFGIDYPAPIDIGGFQITTMYGLIYMGAFLSPAIVTFFTAVVVSVFPAFKAMKIDPIEAMRST